MLKKPQIQMSTGGQDVIQHLNHKKFPFQIQKLQPNQRRRKCTVLLPRRLHVWLRLPLLFLLLFIHVGSWLSLVLL